MARTYIIYMHGALKFCLRLFEVLTSFLNLLRVVYYLHALSVEFLFEVI